VSRIISDAAREAKQKEEDTHTVDTFAKLGGG
jgi:hypothetical protein